MAEGKKSGKIYYSMGEVAEMFDVNPSLIRFWESKFDILKPHKNKKGNRLFTPADIENLKLIYHLVKERGMTLDGAAKALKGNRAELKANQEIMNRLLRIRSLLLEIRQEMKLGTDPALEPGDDDITDDLPAPGGPVPKRSPKKSRDESPLPVSTHPDKTPQPELSSGTGSLDSVNNDDGRPTEKPAEPEIKTSPQQSASPETEEQEESVPPFSPQSLFEEDEIPGMDTDNASERPFPTEEETSHADESYEELGPGEIDEIFGQVSDADHEPEKEQKDYGVYEQTLF